MIVRNMGSKAIVAFIVSLALFMDALDTTIINTAIPAISRSLHVYPVDLKIALISYLLSLAIFIPISGWVADRYGMKNVFISALGFFTLSSLWCGYASTLPELVLARCMQGLGGSLMLPLGRLIILRTFERHQVVEAMNLVIMVVSLGLMLGPVAGGYITDHFSWHWIFWVNIPVGLFAMGMAAYWLQETTPRKVRPFDMVGFLLFGGGLACVTFSMAYFSETRVNLMQPTVIMLIGFFMLFCFLIYSRKQAHPIVNLKLFHKRTFRISVSGNLCARLGFGGMPFLLPLLMQIGLGYSAELAGLLLVPIALGIMLVKSLSIYVLRFLGYKKTLLINTMLVGFALWSFICVNPGTPVYVIAMLTFFFGFLISMQFSAMNSLGYADITADELSQATSLVSVVQQVSQSMGVAVAALLLRFYSSRLTHSYELTPTVFHYAFFALGVLTLFSILIFMNLKGEDGHQMLHPSLAKKVSLS